MTLTYIKKFGLEISLTVSFFFSVDADLLCLTFFSQEVLFTSIRAKNHFYPLASTYEYYRGALHATSIGSRHFEFAHERTAKTLDKCAIPCQKKMKNCDVKNS